MPQEVLQGTFQALHHERGSFSFVQFKSTGMFSSPLPPTRMALGLSNTSLLFPCFLFGLHFKPLEQSSSDCWPIPGLPCPLSSYHAHPTTLTAISLTPLEPPHTCYLCLPPCTPQSGILTCLPPSPHPHQMCPPLTTSGRHAAVFNKPI